MSYCFFFSYARTDDINDRLTKFYKDLVTEIQLRIGNRGINEIGFRDEVGVEIGELWPETLAHALRTTQIFIYAHSPTYFTREWCGKEWQIFCERIDKYVQKYPEYGNPRPPLMIPVLWVPKGSTPLCASHIQFAHGDLGDIYGPGRAAFSNETEKT